MNADIAPFLAPRTKLVDELIARLQRYHIIRVRGTPASGKTTLMRLVANKLFETHGKTTPIHVLTGWKYDELRSNWESYLEKVTGVHGRKWLVYSIYLLIGEAQTTYSDSTLWSSFFKNIEPWLGGPRVILFSTYGTPGNTAFEPIDVPEYRAVPMRFGPKQEISLRTDESPGWCSSSWSSFIPVGSLLEKDEVLTRFAKYLLPQTVSLTEDLKKGLALSSNGHLGLLTDLIHLFRDVPVSNTLVHSRCFSNILLD